MSSPDLLVIGHVARDLSPEGIRLGGTVTFGAVTALKLGLRPAVLTSAGPDIDIPSSLPDVPAREVHSPVTTTFRNTYSRGRRRQLLISVAAPITPSHIPDEWRSAPMVLLGPIAGELSPQMAGQFPDSLVLASLQGWLRQRDSRGLVTPRWWEGRDLLPYVDAAVVSDDDIQDRRLVDLWADLAPVLIVTMGSQGARLHREGTWERTAPFPSLEVDPTGAGDVFAAAYLIRYRETMDPLEAARFASCAASFCVEAEGTAGIPTRAQVHERLHAVGA